VPATRLYRMVARAEAAEATRLRILDAARQLFADLLYDQVSLNAVAARAGVTVQTVIRRFTSKEHLFAAVAQWKSAQIRGERDQAPAGDLAGAICTLFNNYERWGDDVLNLLAQEQRTEVIRQVTDTGRRHHYAWVERVFAPLLEHVPPEQRARGLAQLIAVSDVYTWKILRRDLGMSRVEAEAAVRELVAGILQPAEASASPGRPVLSAPLAGPHAASGLP
jgi:AcrR family transcriptional regulator